MSEKKQLDMFAGSKSVDADGTTHPLVPSKAAFQRLGAWMKGYLVYSYGERDDEPHVPRDYTPDESEREAYEKGQLSAVLAAQDSEE